MKGIFKKNQLIITSLAVMIAIAGYLNFSGKDISMVNGDPDTSVQTVEDELEVPEGEIGEAVLTVANVESFVAETKLSREQIHTKAKEELQSILNNANVEEAVKQDAVDQLAKLSDRMEKQEAAEEVLATKGFLNSVVTINDESVDVSVVSQDLSAVSRAQIEDVITRTCGCSLDEIVITKMNLTSED